MPDTTSIDSPALHAAADRLDSLFGESGTVLHEADQAIADSVEGWKEAAATAFGRFIGYLEGRRSLLQTNLGEMSELMRTTADSTQVQDQATSQGLHGQSPSGPASLAL
ncbi:WXG100 family type VII secretion target [Nocardia sp. NPDC051750]|uniref:WXG100 family type VII secretion target n=1 Tax=Nocardia sp. NPDC051750 TaxID=3364325 RepID=UPI00379FDAB9